eukprot:gnl/TRDRNA2_/TRDRNA2_130863_c0_seq1.p1 gnl/TRDRNA2_/TRDRNA2_130863_c0~~gnl/TRDRNA2_/TRDRNA2_130863_c0_seq1.p1  ORF type:complete len:322 (-),score=79.76 gnl/TRDRNA2_/TRDRNA2_130863_c0_seq1:229-1194(-)
MASDPNEATVDTTLEEASEPEEDDDEEAPELPLPPAYLQKGQRQSVSAEAYGAWNTMKAFEPPVYPKTEEQTARLQNVLSMSILFNSLDRDELMILINAMIEKNVEAETRLIQEGDDGNVMYVIESGVVECIKKIDGEPKVVKTCMAGDFFGELALLYNCPRAATVESRQPCVLWELDRETFNAIVRDASMKKRELYEEFLKSTPILESLGSYERMALADALRKETLPAGTEVIQQGTVGDRFYLVEDGDLSVTKHGTEVLTYKRGDYFGELALLGTGNLREATVTTSTECKLLSVDRRTFKNLLGDLQQTMREKAESYSP